MANENMIQKHEDNFLAKIAGETPIDDKPRNSTEFWLNEIAENLPGGGTEVIANPTLAGTEDPLTGLQVGDTKYVIPVGDKVYRHTLVLRIPGLGSAVNVSFILYNTDSQQFNNDSLYDYLRKVFPMITTTYPDVPGLMFCRPADYGSATHILTGHFYAPESTLKPIKCYCIDYTIGGTSTAIHDNVTVINDTVTEM